ncbi:HNH endonuclease [Halobacillus ihumii]|uniref:HNH endonuclease n=1 Tax=Halobacillus ihumii TaxID=2686092 RepID=UPI0013D5F1D2|nr:HNH endonuclease signature motif containing protein [Halobacillus ihumii]
MPRRPSRPCGEPGCNTLTATTYCEEHKGSGNTHDQFRESAYRRGYDNRWRKYREVFLRSNPLCKHCRSHGQLVPATEVDHIRPHRGDSELFWEPSNHQALCKPCHSRKTAKGL